jgi:RND superfamily putative drug exporter
MHLLGKSAWWLPKWMDRIIPDVDVEGAKLERTHPVSHETEVVDLAVGEDSAPRHPAHRA